MNDSLYQASILEAAKQGAAPVRLEAPNGQATLDNPLCGDRVTIEVTLAADAFLAIGHEVKGCMLCQATTALIARELKDRPANALEQAENAVREMLKGSGNAPIGDLAPFAIFLPVRPHRGRHRCVLLPFETARAAVGAARSL
jgi:nitrogen fixation protein NifU and related proteins